MSRDIKYIGMDVHKEAMVIAVLNGSGKLVMESIVETKASSTLQFMHGLQGELHVTWEEGTWAAWLYDLLKPHVHEVLVSNPRRNALLKEGSKSDKVDARKLADLLRTGMLRPVYHGENGLRTLRELARSYQTISKDLNRVMNRLKAVYRGWGMACAGTKVYAPRYREEWLNKIPHAGVRRRAELLYEPLDGLQALRRKLRPELLAESRKHKAAKLLRQIPCIGPIRAARLIAKTGATFLLQGAHFRGHKRSLNQWHQRKFQRADRKLHPRYRTGRGKYRENFRHQRRWNVDVDESFHTAIAARLAYPCRLLRDTGLIAAETAGGRMRRPCRSARKQATA